MKDLDTDICPLIDTDPESLKELQRKLHQNHTETENHLIDSNITFSKYEPLPYFSNYYPIVDATQQQRERNTIGIHADVSSFNNTFSNSTKDNMLFPGNVTQSNGNKRTEYMLKKYYEAKRSSFNNSSISSSQRTKSSGTTGNEFSSAISNADSQKQQKERNMSLTYVDEFLKTEFHNSESYGPFDPIFDPAMIITSPPQLREGLPDSRKSMSSYFRYIRHLSTMTHMDSNKINKHRLWVPSNTKKFRESIAKTSNLDLDRPTSPSTKSHYSNTFDNNASTEPLETISPLDYSGEDYITKIYGSYSGMMTTPKIHCENKLPAFNYHCSVPVDDEVFIFGGLVPSYKYDEEAPSLDDFEVNGIEYLPPPLLDDIINNPSMVGNPFVYIVTTSTNHIRRAPLLGQIPPNLLCATASMLNNRYIFICGGFEVKTKTHFNPITGKYILEKSGFVNNVGYIFDTKTFYFTKIEILLEDDPNNSGIIKNFSSRFGHAQVSIGTKDSVDSVLSDTESSSSKPSTNNNTATSGSANGHSVNTVLIFGGYKQVGDKKYEPVNDLWKIDIPVTMRSKRDYLNFGESATARLIMDENDSNNANFPSKRAFMGHCLMDRVPYSNNVDLERDIFKNLEKYSRINHEVAKTYLHSYPSHQPSHRQGTRADTTPDIGIQINYKRNHEKSIEETLTVENTPNYQAAITNKKPPSYRALLIHGGSAETEVFDDLWWFDLDNFKWEMIDLFGKTKPTEDKESDLVPVSLKLVGHSMKVNSNILSFDGGLNQDDVNRLYEQKDTRIHLGDTDKIRLDDLQSKSFDLSTQCLFGHQVVDHSDDDKSVYVDVISDLDRCMPTFFGTDAVCVRGRLVIIGGLYARRQTIEELFLRGTMIYAIPVRYTVQSFHNNLYTNNVI